ncbi:MAG TPA: VWA domain-containing protein [Pyrinomonadaceae bacterium]|jgi:VWFA-related protein
MKIFIVSILIFALIGAPTFTSLAQTSGNQDPQDDEIVAVGANEVLLDAVVKDKKGRALKDLKPSDFEVYEDGVRQEVRSFRLITRGASRASETATVPPPSGTQRPQSSPPWNTNRVSAVALVFDRLSPDARVRARDAALNYVGDEVRPDDFIGVFGIDLSLRVLQPFTNRGQLVREAIQRASTKSPSTYASSTEQISTLSQRQAALQSQASVTEGAAAGGGQGIDAQAANGIAANANEQAFNQMTLNALETFERLEREQQGHATSDGLLAIINALGRLPGRKALLFFSEGLAIPAAVESRFRSVISNANRANVSIYSVDAAGLRVLSSDADAGRALTALGQRRAAQAASNRDLPGPMTRDLERNEDLMRLNPEGGLGQLANETGGLYIGSTNNPGERLRQVDEDLHAYYVLTYSPQNQNFDGRFRQINLKVNRPGVEVQTRRGYYAINSSYATPVLAYEAPALALLGGGGASQPNAFPSRVAAFSFPEPANTGLVPVMVEVPANSVNFVASNEKKSYGTNFSVVVLIKDESQRVVSKLSNQYLLSGPLDKLESARRGKILFYRETKLEPGRYSIASVVYDATNGQASTNASSLVVTGESRARLRLSSIVIVKSAERLAADQNTSNPFHFGEVIIYPNMEEPLSKTVSKNLAFFVTVYPAEGASAAPKLRLEILKGGRALAKLPLELPVPDATGRIQYASAIPIDKFQPGNYELKLTAEDAQSTVTRSEQFTIVP